MIRTLGISWVALLLGAGLSAQTTSPFVGNWKVTWEGEAQTYDARLVVTETGGTWKTSARQKNNPCVGREVPVKIESTSPSELRMVLQFSEVVSGCSDSKVTLRLGADSTVTGKRGKADLQLTREQ